MGYTDLDYDVTAGVATITISRPERRNALRIETYTELAAALEEAGADDQVGVVVITGAGERAFSAGGDLEMARERLTTVPAVRTHSFQRMIRVSTLMTTIGAPVVCAVNGAAVGGGAELICFADLVIAADSATFCYNGTKVGGCSWWGAPQLLPLTVGLRRAEEILYLSATLTAAQALEYGLVNRVVPAARLREATAQLADQLLGLSAEGLRQTKAALRSVREVMLLSMSSAAEQNASAVAGPDIQRAFQTFLDKGTIDWRSTRPGLDGRGPR
jgi:2-ketocyclohexanecarboxyl-CoA hydrolase